MSFVGRQRGPPLAIVRQRSFLGTVELTEFNRGHKGGNSAQTSPFCQTRIDGFPHGRQSNYLVQYARSRRGGVAICTPEKLQQGQPLSDSPGLCAGKRSFGPNRAFSKHLPQTTKAVYNDAVCENQGSVTPKQKGNTMSDGPEAMRDIVERLLLLSKSQRLIEHAKRGYAL